MYSVQSMFASATLKLTVWYLSGVMLLSLGFSLLVYNLSLGEFSARLSVIETRLKENNVQISHGFDFNLVRQRQLQEAQRNLVTMLIYINMIILGIGGAGSYVWARRTLYPIEEAHEAQARFTSDASHELRTPLAVIQAETESVLRDKTATKATYRETLESNLEEVQRLVTLSNLLLKLARLDTDSLTWQSVNLADAAQQAVQSFSVRQQKRIAITTRHKPLVSHANPESLTELFVILLDNALKYSTPNTPITVRLYKEKGRACCSVTNQGEGIQKEDINCIFRRFYQADTARNKAANSGYGLGLSLAKKIVELHHGDIVVKSTKSGTTTFTVKLP